VTSEGVDARLAYNAQEMAQNALQSTKPDSLRFGLADLPATQAAWILEKLNRWTDNRGDLEVAVSQIAILDLLTTDWVTNTGARSARLYYEAAVEERMALLLRVETRDRRLPGRVEWGGPPGSRVARQHRALDGDAARRAFPGVGAASGLRSGRPCQLRTGEDGVTISTEGSEAT
jgi:hypothetical protein